MKSFIIKRLDKQLELEEFNYKFKGFKYKTNNARLNDMHVREITIVNQELIDVLIKYSFTKFLIILTAGNLLVHIRLFF